MEPMHKRRRRQTKKNKKWNAQSDGTYPQEKKTVKFMAKKFKDPNKYLSKTQVLYLGEGSIFNPFTKI